MAATELLYLRDAYLGEFDAAVTAVDGDRVALDRTAFYPTGGGQPHDTGSLGDARVTSVKKEGDIVWHTLDGVAPAEGETVHGEVDWDRRHALMRTHSVNETADGDPTLALFSVLRDDGTADPQRDPFLPRDALLAMYEQMLLIRRID